MLFKRAKELIPGGVNSPVRAFKAVGGTPPFIAYGFGSRLVDVDGNEFIDYVCSWGALILGHAHPEVVSAVKATIERGSSFGASTEAEVTFAEMLCEAIPSVEMVRLVNSGTEAVMSAIRVARAFTGRQKVIKFIGCYHGHVDYLLVKAGSGIATFAVPDSAGVPSEFASLTIALPYNDTDAFVSTMRQFGSEIAAVIVEPVAGNMGVVLPKHGFLEALREETERYRCVLIFDEVITGFRLCYGGAQNLFNVTPDITVLGKIIGGGFPIGAYGGRRELMELVAPLGSVYQAGTLSGNPIAVAAGIATLNVLKREQPYEKLSEYSKVLSQALIEAAAKAKIKLHVNFIGSMLTPFFTDTTVSNFDDVSRCDTGLYARFFHQMLSRGVYMPPSQFEAAFVSTTHSDEDLERTIEAINEALTACTDSA
ncbi:MAG: glutamate-1-semialdehyde 2,1-aminomutase [Armatimonadetes bacterium]|nr:glutamate-1-semialdehyde 2,1-aminomutase [Armatimonadota bacterium]MCX7776739.1 glutamate-1-semialdehyde 2,1-aminomutase [Armatimonadota bacterium]